MPERSPEIVAPPPDTKRLLARMAVLAQSFILKRAFNSGVVARSINDTAVKELDREYAWYKSGTRPYKSELTKAKAARRRGLMGEVKLSTLRKMSPTRVRLRESRARLRKEVRKLKRTLGLKTTGAKRGTGNKTPSFKKGDRGPFGWGPIAYTEGGRKRLGVRPPVADQVLSGGTRQAFGKIREDAESITLGFRTARSQEVATHLQVRNQFFPLTPDESEAVLKLGEEYLHELAKKIKLRNSTITIVL